MNMGYNVLLFYIRLWISSDIIQRHYYLPRNINIQTLTLNNGWEKIPLTKEGRSHYCSPLMTTSLIPSKEQRCIYFIAVKDLVKISAAYCSVGQYSREIIPYAMKPRM